MPDEPDLGRYDSAAGWEPKDPYKKQRELARKQQHPDLVTSDTMLEFRPASEWITRGRRHRVRQPELFGPLWREGEIAVLFGETGAGKSILAVQIAESIARGVRSFDFVRPSSESKSTKIGTPCAQKALYLDFEQTERQFAERYSVPSPIPGKLPVRQRFKFLRAEIKWDGHVPAEFKDDLNEYLRHSIFQSIEESGARVIIIDNISYIARNITSNSECVRVMKTLKLWASTRGLSILMLAHSKCRRRGSPHAGGRVAGSRGGGSPLALDQIAGGRSLADLADSVFAIGRSTFGDDIRYLKHLKSRSTQITNDESNVLTYRLGRVSSPHVSKGSVLIPHSAIRTPHPEGPFLGLSYLGPSPESDHLRDYEREARDLQTREPSAHRKPKNIVDMLMSREYQRYLKS